MFYLRLYGLLVLPATKGNMEDAWYMGSQQGIEAKHGPSCTQSAIRQTLG